jgi:acetyltransferase
MDFFFNPRSVAVVGATTNEARGGYSILKNLMSGFKGTVFPVNPSYTEIGGIPCYPEIGAVPGDVDLAIIFVPSAAVPAVVEKCVLKGIRGVIIESGGFAESGEEGRRLQDSLKEIRMRTGIRIWGPNCMGVIDPVRSNYFSFLNPKLIAGGLEPGSVSLIVQSGMLAATFLLDIISNGLAGISKACSIGNKADVDESDILEYLLDDQSTGAIALYLESFADGRRFADICRKSAKPIVVLKGGKSARGAEAAMSHTASLAGNHRVASDILKQAGVIEATDFQQMIDFCRTLDMVPVRLSGTPAKVAIITFSGGSGIICTDLMEGRNLELADLADSTKAALKKIFPEWMPVANPIDIWPAIEMRGRANTYNRVIEAVAGDPSVDAIVIHAPALEWFKLKEASESNTSGKPMFVWLVGNRDMLFKFRAEGRSLGIPVYSEISRTVECISAVFRKAPVSAPECSEESKQEGARINSRSVAGKSQGVLDEYESKNILKNYGIPVVDEGIVYSRKGLEQTCDKFGFPIVMKGLLPGGIHKTELGLVSLNIADKSSALKTFNELAMKMKGKGSILVQRQAAGRVELILGLLRDANFGPCVMCGIGGIYAELLNDAVFAMAPLGLSDALNAIGSLKNQRILDGFRGAPPVDRHAVADIMVKLGRIGQDNSNILQIDINPLLAGPDGLVAVDATIILE